MNPTTLKCKANGCPRWFVATEAETYFCPACTANPAACMEDRDIQKIFERYARKAYEANTLPEGVVVRERGSQITISALGFSATFYSEQMQRLLEELRTRAGSSASTPKGGSAGAKEEKSAQPSPEKLAEQRRAAHEERMAKQARLALFIPKYEKEKPKPPKQKEGKKKGKGGGTPPPKGSKPQGGSPPRGQKAA